jgi:hypothetical protein
MKLKKHKGLWVHPDSEKESELSRAIGGAIEASNGHLSGASSEGHPPFSGVSPETPDPFSETSSEGLPSFS